MTRRRPTTPQDAPHGARQPEPVDDITRGVPRRAAMSQTRSRDEDDDDAWMLRRRTPEQVAESIRAKIARQAPIGAYGVPLWERLGLDFRAYLRTPPIELRRRAAAIGVEILTESSPLPPPSGARPMEHAPDDPAPRPPRTFAQPEQIERLRRVMNPQPLDRDAIKQLYGDEENDPA